MATALVRYAAPRAYSVAGRLARAYKAGMKRKRTVYAVGKYGWRNRKRFKRAIRTIKKIANNAITRKAVSNIYSIYQTTYTDTVLPDQFNSKSLTLNLPRQTDTSVLNQGRTSDTIYLSGCRVQYCFHDKPRQDTNVSTPPFSTGNIYTKHFIRMALLQDKWSNNEEQQFNLKENIFSGVGQVMAAGADNKQGIDFADLEPKCTKFVHPINNKRYRVLAQKKIVLNGSMKGALSANGTVGKWWIPLKKTIKYSHSGDLSSSGKFNLPHIHFVWWYQRADDKVDSATLTSDIKLINYFKNI